MAYIYRHIRLDKNEPFYIGIGEDEVGKEYKYKRANRKCHRNQHWKNIDSKTTYEIEIIEDDLTWEEACQKEIWWINFYGRADLNLGPLCNMTNGGEGTKGCKSNITEYNKKRSSEFHKGKPKSFEHKEKLKETHWTKDINRCDEIKKKIRETLKQNRGLSVASQKSPQGLT